MLRMSAALVAFFLMAASAHAQQTSRLDDIVKRGSLRVGMTGDYLPFSYFDRATSKFRGFDVDMAEALGKALGVKVAYVRTAWPQLMISISRWVAYRSRSTARKRECFPPP